MSTCPITYMYDGDAVVGLPGERGENGEPGVDGQPGEPGSAGRPGENGKHRKVYLVIAYMNIKSRLMSIILSSFSNF